MCRLANSTIPDASNVPNVKIIMSRNLEQVAKTGEVWNTFVHVHVDFFDLSEEEL